MKRQYVQLINKNWTTTLKLKLWLVEQFGANGDRWGEEGELPDLPVIWMDEDVYQWFCLSQGY